jgi:carotenoid 1,2-hydratase
MTERGTGDLQRGRDWLGIGPSHLQWDGDSLLITIRERCMPFPSPLRGTVRVRPEALTGTTFPLDPAARHRWSPLSPRAHVEVALAAPALHWSGPGYLDCNNGDAPLERDFTSWDWSCARLSRGAGLLYDTNLRDGSTNSLALHVAADGAVTHAEIPPRQNLARTSLWRVARTTQTTGQARITRTLLDAPFYARSVMQTEMFGESAEAMHESLSLDRFRSPIVQAMLPFRMPRWAKG